MKYFALLFFLLISTGAFAKTKTASNPPGHIGESDHYKFYSHFWFNMHHLFHQEAINLEVAKKSKIPASVWNRLPARDKEQLKKAVSYYRKNLLDKDLRFSDYMTEFKKWILVQDPNTLSSIPEKFKEHASHLQKVEKLYRKAFWRSHDSSNKNILNNNSKLIKNTERGVVKKLSDLTKQPWQKDKIRVDITFYGKSTRRNMRNLPYTSLEPTHVVMPSAGKIDDPAGNWLELLYHESSHNLIGSRSGFVGGTIVDVAEASGEKPLRNLWHAYLFYFSGIVTRDALKTQGIENYKLYMIRRNVFSSYIPHLKKHLPSYVNHESTLKDVTESIFRDFNKSP